MLVLRPVVISVEQPNIMIEISGGFFFYFCQAISRKGHGYFFLNLPTINNPNIDARVSDTDSVVKQSIK
jgi:hypothetical protein